MKLIYALHKSPLRAAIIASPFHAWNIVVVEWGPHQYTKEIHQYNQQTGNLMFQVVSYEKVNEQQIRLQLGEATYFSSEWEPYENPTPPAVQGHYRKIAKNHPRLRKEVRKYPADEFSEIFSEIFTS